VHFPRFDASRFKGAFLLDYDATSLAPTESASPEFHQTVFPVFSAPIMLAAEKLASKLRLKKAFTVMPKSRHLHKPLADSMIEHDHV